MSMPEIPRLYLITPPEIELSHFPEVLASLMDAHDVACVRMALSTHDEDALCRAADACRAVTTPRDVALVIDTHFILAERLGLDGVHLGDGARSVRKARTALGKDAIVGSFCGVSRHDGLSAGEAGADYVSFGPAGVSALGDGKQADGELFEWWSQMIEVPIVAEGALDRDAVAELAQTTDFLAFGNELWQSDDPLVALDELVEVLSASFIE
ncbi:MAG: thiamine phosphate synthase [Pseudomonadota bacterium]